MSAAAAEFQSPPCLPFDPFAYARRRSTRIEVSGWDGRPVALGGDEVIKVAVTRSNFGRIAHKVDRLGDFKPDFVVEDSPLVALDPRDPLPPGLPEDALVTVKDGLDLPAVTAFRLLAARLAEAGCPALLLLKDTLHPPAPADPAAPDTAGPSPRFLDTLLSSSAALGSLICDGLGDAILVQGEPAPGQSLRLAFNILQASGARIFKTDYVACPSCGRTLFNLQETTARIKAATVHLKGVKIAIMGCIVNGPGEMADADFGYVGGAPGKINLYVGKQAVKFNIPEVEAVSRLVDLIKEHGRWVEPPPPSAPSHAPALAD
jgi:(E)-4-hydroxy-3-methylbut-2-enyl-diphosphate synthase